MDYAECRACSWGGELEEARNTGGSNPWDQDFYLCPRCGSDQIEKVANGSRPDPKLEDARRCLREANSIGAASHNLSVELGTGEGIARKHLARAIRADIANEYNLDADEVDRLVRLAVTKI